MKPPGKIIETLGQMKCMNPIFYFDELDKVSDTPRGHEIYNLLCHLTDSSQNDEFHDKYFAGIDFDLSRAIFVFSFNDEEQINPILRDRMKIIRTKGFEVKDKINIAKQYLIPEIIESLHFDSSAIHMTDSILETIIQQYTKEEGVRMFKQHLESFYHKMNLLQLYKKIGKFPDNIMTYGKSITFPYTPQTEDLSHFITKDSNELSDMVKCSGMY